jgi:acyl-homoserine lactone acylase PvdQ
VDGSSSATEWLGIHPTKDLIQILNPPQGYMQNCNIPPDVMMVDSPMQPERYKPYLFNQRSDWTHQRAARCVELLDRDSSVTVAEAQAYALDTKCYQYDRWVDALQRADARFGAGRGADYKLALKEIRNWNGFSRRDSAAALKYYYWRHTISELAGEEQMMTLIGKINDYMDLFRPAEASRRLSDEEQRLLADSLEKAIATMREHLGTLDAVYGDVFRVGRLDGEDDVSWPVGGGSLRFDGMATLRAVGFTPPRADHTRWGRSGQTSTEVVILTKPIQSFTQPPIGQSDHADSPHYRDQAEKLFGPARMKPSWYHKHDLLDGHVERTYQISYPSGSSR